MNNNLKSFLEEFRRQEFNNIEKEKRSSKNFPYAFKGQGDFGEELALILFPKSFGSASKGGMSFDNYELDTGKNICLAREIKTTCLNGIKHCKNCNYSTPYFQSNCVYCNNNKFKFSNDSRFGIDSNAHLKYKDQLKYYILIIIKYIDNDDYIKLFVYKIKSKNKYFKKYIKNQKSNGKANTCNLLPFSYDFWCCGPIKLIDINLYRDNILINKYDINNKKEEDIPFINWNTNKPIFYKCELSVYNLLEQNFPVNYNKIKDKLILRKKNLGKNRGHVTRL